MNRLRLCSTLVALALCGGAFAQQPAAAPQPAAGQPAMEQLTPEQRAALAKQEKLEGWQWVQKRFEKLGQHRKQPSGLNIWTCEVTGPRKSRRLHGYLLASPDALFQETPPDNPYLRLLNEAAKREDSALGAKDDDQA